MEWITRRTAVKAVASVAVVGLSGLPMRQARAAKFSMKLGTAWPAEHPTSAEARAACDTIREQSNGEVDVQFYPNNVLGSDTDMLSQVRSGALEFVFMPSGVLSTFVPVASINNVGFAFDNYDQVWKAMDGGLGAYVREQLNKSGLGVMDKIWDNGFRQLTTRDTPVNSLSDIRGLKIRVPVAAIYTTLFKALGASAVSANISELYSALQTKVFDGQENPLSNIKYWRLYEVQKWCALTAHSWEGYWLLASRRPWAQLPADVQSLITKVFNDLAIMQRQKLAAYAEELRPQLERDGMSFTTPDRIPFRQALSENGYYREWKEKFGQDAWKLLETHELS